jgi:type IX secretion system PorP/SprF family membrane protein
MKKVIIFFCVCFSFIAHAQQEPIFTQYYINDMYFNPAVSGSKSYNTLIIQSRKQWLGFEGAPLTTNVSYHGALNNRSAMGGYLMFDKAYPSMQANLNVNYAYHIPLNYDEVHFSFGLGGKVMYHNLDFNEGEVPPGQDNAYSLSAYSKILADASFGTYLYSDDFYFGYSTTNLLESSFNDPVNENFPNVELRNHYGIAGYRFDIINNDWKLEPSLLIRKTGTHASVVDFTTRIFYIQNTWTGVTYRNDGNLVFSFGFGSGNFHLSYSYDYTMRGDIAKYNFGTHEFGISFHFERY